MISDFGDLVLHGSISPASNKYDGVSILERASHEASLTEPRLYLRYGRRRFARLGECGCGFYKAEQLTVVYNTAPMTSSSYRDRSGFAARHRPKNVFKRNW